MQDKAASRKVQLDNAFLLQTFLANSRDLVRILFCHHYVTHTVYVIHIMFS